MEARIVEELRSLDLLATPERPHVRELEYEDLGKLQYLSCAIKVRNPLLLRIMHDYNEFVETGWNAGTYLLGFLRPSQCYALRWWSSRI